jgi:hypothetical protein
LPNGQVDFAHFAELAEKMSELMVWTRAKCPFEKDQGLALLLQTSPVLSPKGERACSLRPNNIIISQIVLFFVSVFAPAGLEEVSSSLEVPASDK